MDDQGATSSWYMLSAMGFYPVDPSSQDYIIGSPVFDDVSLDMGNGEKLRIVAKNNSPANARSEEHTSELQSLMRTSYAVFCLKKKKKNRTYVTHTITKTK